MQIVITPQAIVSAVLVGMAIYFFYKWCKEKFRRPHPLKDFCPNSLPNESFMLQAQSMEQMMSSVWYAINKTTEFGVDLEELKTYGFPFHPEHKVVYFAHEEGPCLNGVICDLGANKYGFISVGRFSSEMKGHLSLSTVMADLAHKFETIVKKAPANDSQTEDASDEQPDWDVPDGLKMEAGHIYRCHNGNVGICRENELPGKDIYPFFLEFFHVARHQMSVPRNYTESGHAHHERHPRPDNIKFEIVTPNPQ